MIIIATRRGTIQVADRSTREWFGPAALVGSSLLGFVAPTERLAALQFVEELFSRPGVAMTGHLQLGHRGGREQAYTVLGAAVGEFVVIQFRSRRQSADHADESLTWAADDAMITMSLPLPIGSTIADTVAMCRALTSSEVHGVHFGPTGMSIVNRRFGHWSGPTDRGAFVPVPLLSRSLLGSVGTADLSYS